MKPPAASPPGSVDVWLPESKLIDSQGVVVSQNGDLAEKQGSENKAAASLLEVSSGNNSEKSDGSSQKISTTNPEIPKPQAKKSWVQVAQKHVFSKQKFVVSEVDGKERVVVPKEVFVGAKPLWEDFLIGKFLSTKAPHVGKIHMIVNKIWRLGDRSSLIDVLEVDETIIKFRIRNEAMRNRVLNRGMWNIMDIPMIVSKWTPYAEEVQPALKSIPLWITLTHVPMSMFTDKGLEFLASAVGEPKRLHPKTEACVSFEEAQILVEADLTKNLPEDMLVIC